MNRAAKTAMELIIQKIVVYEDHLDIRLQANVDSIL